MAEKLTMKVLAGELDALRKQVLALEAQLDKKIDSAVDKAVMKMQSRMASAGSDTAGRGINADERQRLIAEVAYIRAERRGFEGGSPEQDWLDAEDEVNRMLMQGSANQAKRSKPAKRSAAKRG